MVEGAATLKLTRHGRTISQTVSLGPEEKLATVAGPAIIDLDGQGDPEVVLQVYSCGAYCCAFTLTYHYVPARKTYGRVKHLWGPYRNMAALAKSPRDGLPEFVSRNEDFSGWFGRHAVSGASPIQVWRFRLGRLQDVTRSYPELIRQDTQVWWDAYTQEESDWHQEPVALAAYLAGMHLLGEGDKGWQEVKRIYQGDDREEFFLKMRRKLREYGYAK